MINLRSLRPAAAGAAIALTALAVASAQAFSPPRGTPGLAKMTLQRSDLAAGVTLEAAYMPPGLHMRAEYESTFGPARTKGSIALAEIHTTLTLDDTTAWAQREFAQVKPFYGSSDGRELMVDEVVPIATALSGAFKHARFGNFRSIGAGQQSLFQSVTIPANGKTLVADFVWLRVGAVVASLVFIADAPKLADSVSITLARTVAAHIESVLAAAGSRSAGRQPPGGGDGALPRPRRARAGARGCPRRKD